MRTEIRAGIAGLAVAGSLGCGADERDLSVRAGAAGGETAVAQVQDTTHALGDSIYNAWCAECHALYPPETKAPDEWFGTVQKMQDLARGARVDTLTREQLFAVADYLEARAREARDP